MTLTFTDRCEGLVEPSSRACSTSASSEDGKYVNEDHNGRCTKKLSCGHRCHGIESSKCLPCLEPGCPENQQTLTNKEELCAICYTSELAEEPCVALGCGHIYHKDCMIQLLKHKWSSLKISFAFMSCPECKTAFEWFDCIEAQKELTKLKDMKKKIEEKGS